MKKYVMNGVMSSIGIVIRPHLNIETVLIVNTTFDVSGIVMSV